MLALEAVASNAWDSAALCAGGVAKRRGLISRDERAASAPIRVPQTITVHRRAPLCRTAQLAGRSASISESNE